MCGLVTYQLHITLSSPCRMTIGRLGTFDFPEGRYVYTGSARRNLEARISRHLRQEKNLHWHIDFLLASPAAGITLVERHAQPECEINASFQGSIIAPGFGASDCRMGCGSHLKFLGK